MKVIYLVHQFYPQYYMGTEKVVYNIASNINKMGNDVKIITYSFYEESWYSNDYMNILYDEVEYNGLKVINFKYKDPPNDLKTSLYNSELEQFAKEILIREKPDIIHVAHSMRVGAFIKASKKLEIPYILTLTDYFLLCPRYLLLMQGYKICDGCVEGAKCDEVCSNYINESVKERYKTSRGILENAHTIIAPSNFVKDLFEREFKGINVKVINHGIDFEGINQKDKIYKNNNKLTLCYAGSIYYHKGLHVILEAIKLLQDYNLELIIYGSGVNKEYNDYIEQLMKNDSRIRLLGTYSEDRVGEALEKADIVIIPSVWNETYCLVLYEALACNIPVIVSNIGALTEKLTNNVNGYIFNFNDVESLKNCILKLINNTQELNRIKENIKMEDIPTIDTEVNDYVSIYNQVIFDME